MFISDLKPQKDKFKMITVKKKKRCNHRVYASKNENRYRKSYFFFEEKNVLTLLRWYGALQYCDVLYLPIETNNKIKYNVIICFSFPNSVTYTVTLQLNWLERRLRRLS